MGWRGEKRSGQGERAAVERLEPRILYSADLSPLASTVIGPQAAEQRVIDTNMEFAAQSQQVSQFVPNEVVFVDARTPDYALLVQDIAAQSERQLDVVMLAGDRDGLEQISDALAGRENVAAVHIIAHGGEGMVQLGSKVFDADALERRALEIEAWQSALAADADILLYGCDIAASAQGQLFVDALARLTDADVSASDDATGHASLGGDWSLEYATGAIDVPVAPSASAQEAWSYLLPSVVLTSYEPTFGSMADNTYEVSGSTSYVQSFTHTSGSGTYAVNQIDLVLYKTALTSGPAIEVELRATPSGGGLLASGHVSRDALGTSEGWALVSLDATATLTDGVTYYIRVPSTGAGDAFIGVDDTGAYAGGSAIIDGTAEPTKDLAFRVVFSDGPVVDLNGNQNGQDWTAAFTEQTPVSIARSNAAITDADSANLAALTATLTARPDGDLVESLSLNAAATAAAGGLTVSYTAATGVLSITGSASVATYQTILQGIQYNNTSDAPTTIERFVTVVANDGTTPSAVRTSVITVAGLVNDAPVNTVPGAQTTNEDTARVFSAVGGNAISIADDAGANSVQVALTGTNGVITLAGTAGLVFSVGDGTADGAMTFTGTLAAINTALDGLSFAPTANFSGAASLSITTNDQGNTGTGGAISDTDAVAITVTAVNDAPVVAGAGGTLAYTEGDAATVIDATLTVSDADDVNIESATVTIGTGLVSTEDVLGFTSAFGITGSYTAGTGVLALSGSATLAQYQSVLEGVTYLNTNIGNPSTGARTITWVVNDGTDSSAGATSTVTVAAVNDAPVADLNAGGAGLDVMAAFTEQTPVQIAPVATLADVDSANLTSLTAALTARPDGNAVESLALNAAAITAASGAGLTVSYTAATGVLSITGSATAATYQTILQGIEYNNTSDAPNTTDRSVTVVAHDGALPSATATSTVTVTAVNDAPTGADKTVTTNEDTAYVFSAADFGFGDVDAGDSLSAVRIDTLPGAGTLKLSGAAVSATDVITAANIPNLTFEPGLDGNGSGYASFTFSVRDQSNAFDAVPNTITVDVTALNDAPVVDLNAAGAGQDVTVAFTEQTPVLIAPAGTLADVDTANLAALTVTLTARPDGNAVEFFGFNAAAAAVLGGMTVNYTATTGVLSITGSASVATYQTILQGIEYYNTSDAPTTTDRSVTVVANDGALSSATQSSTITVTAVNETPVNTVPGAQVVNEDTALSIAGLSVNDVDGNLAITQLSVASGTLNVSLAGGASISAGGNGTGTLTLAGTQAQVNVALAALSYQGNLNFNGADVLTVLSIDSAGVPLSDTDTVALTVAAVNDAPVVGAGATLAYTQKGVSAVIDSTITLSDVDDAQFLGATATIAAPVAGDTLTFVDQNGITGGFAGGVLTLTGNATPANYEAALRSVTYSSSASDPTVNGTRPTRTITWTVTDANSATAAATSTVNLGGLAAPIGIVSILDPGLPGATTPVASTPPPVTAPAPVPGATGPSPAAAAGGPRIAVETAGSGGGLTSDAGALLVDIGQLSQALQSAGAPTGAPSSGLRATGAANFGPAVGAASVGLDIGPLANAQSQASPVFVLEEFLKGGSRSIELVEALDRLRDEIDDKTRLEHSVNGAAAAAGMSLTVGYLLWLARGGILLSSLMASLPAWRLLDPLPVLGRMSDDGDDVTEDDSAMPPADTAQGAARQPRETRSA